MYCNAFKMELAAFGTKHEREFVYRESLKITNLPPAQFWTGASKLSSDHTPYWSENGKAVSRDVLEGSSLTDGLNCFGIRKLRDSNKYQFYSENCELAQYFICEQTVTEDYC